MQIPPDGQRGPKYEDPETEALYDRFRQRGSFLSWAQQQRDEARRAAVRNMLLIAAVFAQACFIMYLVCRG